MYCYSRRFESLTIASLHFLVTVEEIWRDAICYDVVFKNFLTCCCMFSCPVFVLLLFLTPIVVSHPFRRTPLWTQSKWLWGQPTCQTGPQLEGHGRWWLPVTLRGIPQHPMTTHCCDMLWVPRLSPHCIQEICIVCIYNYIYNCIYL